MANVSMKTSLPVDAKQVWEAIGNFNALPSWHPAIESSELEDGGTVRRLTVMGGGEIVEKLVARDDEELTYTYSIVSSPLPVINYSATLKVAPNESGGADVEWSGQFEPAQDIPDATKAVQDVYQAGMDNLKKMFGG